MRHPSFANGAVNMVRVLILEDRRPLRDAIVAWLGATSGIELVGEAASISDALPLLELHRPDILLADLSLGIATELVSVAGLAWLRGCVVILTAFGVGFADPEAHGDGMQGYGLEPRYAAEVLEVLRIVALGRSSTALEIARVN